jgi:hypothetical protein
MWRRNKTVEKTNNASALIVRPGESYTFQFLNNLPITWIVDVINEQEDRIYIHKSDGTSKVVSFRHFIDLYKRYGVTTQ